jgi:chaperone required for assembly of F1-ATPase
MSDSNDERPRPADANRIREQAAMRAPLPKRFYKDVSLRQEGGVWQLQLDGREIKTPGKRKLALPSRAVAEGLAEEWRAQEGVIDPGSMPLTRIANSAIEGVAGAMAEVAADIVAFAGSDLVCYRAAGPEALVARQSAAWDPVVAWASETLRARFVLAEGVMPVEQPQTALDQVAAAVAPLDAFGLAGLHVATTLTGSALLALAVMKRRLSPEQAWAAAHVDEDYQIEMWGEDTEARSRRAYRWSEMQAACLIMREGGARA